MTRIPASGPLTRRGFSCLCDPFRILPSPSRSCNTVYYYILRLKMSIGCIGAGNIGSTVAKLAVANGRNVVLTNTRGADSIKARVSLTSSIIEYHINVIFKYINIESERLQCRIFVPCLEADSSTSILCFRLYNTRNLLLSFLGIVDVPRSQGQVWVA